MPLELSWTFRKRLEMIPIISFAFLAFCCVELVAATQGGPNQWPTPSAAFAVNVRFSQKPVLKHKRHEKEQAVFASSISVQIASRAIDDPHLELKLERNDALFSPSYQYMTGSSMVAVQSIRSTAPVNCYYTGSVDGWPDSMVAVSLCDGVNGMIHVGESTRYSIQPQHRQQDWEAGQASAQGPMEFDAPWENRPHVLMLEVDEQPVEDSGQSASVPNESSCATLHPPTLGSDVHALDQHMLVVSADSVSHHPVPPPSLAQSTWVAPNNTRQTIELFIANDFQRLQQWGPALVEQSTVEIVNIVHAMYTRVNVYPDPYTLGVTLSGVFTATDPMWFPQNTSTVDGGSLLSSFCQWRSALRSNSSMAGTAVSASDAAHLFSGRLLSTPSNPNPTGPSLLGMAYVGALCNSWSCGVNYISRTARLSNTATVVAHELGHNAGASHDTSGNNCTSGFLMNPSTCLSCSTHATNFSRCSADYMSSYFRSGLQCLNNLPQTCGNGILDEGEECDSGNRRTGNPCCTETCRLRSTAKCDASNGLCCDPSTCQYRPLGTSCRSIGTNFPSDPPRIACDVPDLCSGTSAKCPDVIAANGTVCQVSNTTGVCNSGVCDSRALACQRSSRTYNATCDALAPSGNQCRLMCADATGRCITLASSGLAVNVSNHMWCAGPAGMTMAGVDGLGKCLNGLCRNATERWVVGEAATGQLVNGTPVIPTSTATNGPANPSSTATPFGPGGPTQPADGSEGASAAMIGGAIGGVAAVGAASGALAWFKWYRVRSLGMAAANSGSMALMSMGNAAGRATGA